MALETITREELRSVLDSGRDVTVVDALGPSDYQESHLPGAINVPKDLVEERAPRLLPDKDAEIVVYCANTACQASRIAAEKLVALGYTNVKDYEAGKADWIEAGLPVGGERAAASGAGD